MTIRNPLETTSRITPMLLLLCGWMLQAGLARAAAAEFTIGQPLPPWQKGQLDLHQINTGMGDAALFVLPDGTSMLLDAGAVQGRKRPPRYDAPPKPNGSRRAGEWIVHYIRQVHPEKAAAALDYAIITHFHSDHMGTLAPDAPRSAAGGYQLAGITDVGDQIPIRLLIDRAAPDYSTLRALNDPMVNNYREFQRWHCEHKGMRVERFEAGRKDQIVPVRAPQDYPQFEIRNVAVNGHVWTGIGSETRSRFPESDPPDENNCSLAFRLRYGKFDYFNGGDMAGEPPRGGRTWREMESAVAWVVGPVDAYALNHHGTKDATNGFFLSVLQPRIHIASIYAASQPGPDVMRRMLSEQTYPGPRDIFLTNAIWDGRRPNMVVLFGEEDAAWLESQIESVAGSQGHVVLRVAEGGDSYHVLLLDDRDERMLVKSVHGPYQSR